jgi:hypothetical protein
VLLQSSNVFPSKTGGALCKPARAALGSGHGEKRRSRFARIPIFGLKPPEVATRTLQRS